MWLIIFLLGSIQLTLTQELSVPATIAFGQLINRLEQCKYLQNATNTEQLAKHEYAAYENCLYYYLASEQQKLALKIGVLHPLATLPPANKVVVTINQITLQQYELNEYTKELRISGYVQEQWSDSRLSWPTDKWKTSKLQIHSASHLWVPILSHQSFETAIRSEDTMEIRRLETSNTGNVTGTFSYGLKTTCEDNFSNYPMDTFKCCFELSPHLHQDVIRFKTNEQPIFTDPKYFREKGWLISGSIPYSNTEELSEISQLNFCINLQRSNSSIKLELNLPVFICALLFLFSTVFGNIKSQLLMKLFVLFLQFLTMMLFNERIASHLGGNNAIPWIMRVHGFCMIINTLSITISGAIMSLTRVRRTLPPYQWLIKASNIVNRMICIINTSEEPEEITNFEKHDLENTVSSSYKKYQLDWTNALIAIHSLLVYSISGLFLFGFLCMYAV
uniref:Neur_chan_LBD domain-containing protein n=1 Tax=Rhabditophanes sp. KR3021 TaxID=114890 RepID=A0AC35TG39_9BILA